MACSSYSWRALTALWQQFEVLKHNMDKEVDTTELRLPVQAVQQSTLAQNQAGRTCRWTRHLADIRLCLQGP